MLTRAIGARVRQERKARDWTLDRLAEAAGVSRRMVVSVEQGSVNPSVGTLLRLNDALGLGLPALVEPPQQHRIKWDWTLAPGERHKSEAHAEGTRELLHVREGTVAQHSGTRDSELHASARQEGDAPPARPVTQEQL